MDLSLSQRWASRWEGYRRRVYPDTRGIPTIGIGLNLTTDMAKHLIAGQHLDYAAILAGTLSLTDEQIATLFSATQKVALAGAMALAPTFGSFPEPQQIVLTDLVFNMGPARFSGFTNTLACIRRQDWSGAAANLKNSAWFHQVGHRAVANVAVLGNTATIQSFL